MKITIRIFALCSMLYALAPLAASAAPQIRKADSVAATAPKAEQQKQAGLMETVLGLTAGIMTLQQDMAALDQRCAPTDTEINWINMMVKRWAEAGGGGSDISQLYGINSCDTGGFKNHVAVNRRGGTNDSKLCFAKFTGAGNDGMIWAKYPMADKVCFCKDTGVECGTGCAMDKQEHFTNAFHVLQLVNFTDADFLSNETNMLAGIRKKSDECTRLSADKKNLVMEFALGTAGTLGQKQGAEANMQNIGTIMNSSQMQGMNPIVGAAVQIPMMMMMGNQM
ncbi:MAG: hypothetical protein FWG39_03420 [Alphaproteobacteria bacterium]|nr:hypothetical protein [Alphaproteobacteria bacterium]